MAVSLLGQDNPCETTAIPALFSNLSQENDANFGKGLIQTLKLHLTVRRLGVLLVSPVEFENGIPGQAVFCRNAGHQGVDHFLQLLNGTTVNTQLGLGPVGIYRILVGVEEFSNAAFDDLAALRLVYNFDHRSFQKVAHTVNERIVVHNVGDFP